MSTSKREEIEFEVDKCVLYYFASSLYSTDLATKHHRMLRESQDRVRELLSSHRHELDLLTEALVEHETLNLKVRKSFFVTLFPHLNTIHCRCVGGRDCHQGRENSARRETNRFHTFRRFQGVIRPRWAV